MNKFLCAAVVCLLSLVLVGCKVKTLVQGVSSTGTGWAWDGCHPKYPICGNAYVGDSGLGGGVSGNYSVGD